MDFNKTVILVLSVLLVMTLLIFGGIIRTNKKTGFPYTQDNCPKLWNTDFKGNCINPICISNNECNSLAITGDWRNSTPGYTKFDAGLAGFNPNHEDWETYGGASNSICGKKNWANEHDIDWNGISSYNSC